MVKKLVMIAFGLTVSCAAAQSLKSQDPAPLQSGVNSGIVDNFVGPHYWYFVGGPGDVHVVVRFKSMGLFGNPIRTPLTATLYDEQRTWHVTKVVTSEKDMAEQTFTGKLDKKLKTIGPSPIQHVLVRWESDPEDRCGLQSITEYSAG